MTRIEDRLRDYYTARAAAVAPEDIPHSVRPRVSPRRARFAPLAAAAAVVAVAITAVVLGNVIHRGNSPAGTAPAPADGKPVAQLVSSGVIPPRFITITAGDAVVRSTATGARLATIQPSVPHGTIVAVTAGADDRTFVLAEQKLPLRGGAALSIDQGSFFLLHLRSDGTQETLTKLPIAAPDGVNGMALSADGTELAMAVRLAASSEVRVYTVATGAVRTWSATGSGFVGDGMLGPDDAASISWAADGRHLLFSWMDGLNANERLLGTSLGGSSLMADSRLVLTIPGRAGRAVLCQGDMIITPDGSAVICPGLTDQTIFFREYSAATGKVIRQLGTRAYGQINWFMLDALWTNPSGSVIIGVIPAPGSGQTGPNPSVTPTSPPPGSDPRIGVVIGQSFTPLDLPGVTSGIW